MTEDEGNHAALLQIDRLRVSARGAEPPLVSDVSLKIDTGALTMIVGRSGSGKSLTLRAILGLLPASIYRVEGHITFEGRSLEGGGIDSAAAVRGTEISIIFQDPAAHLNPLMTIGQHLAEVLNRCPNPSASRRGEDVRSMLAMMRFPDPDRIAASYPHQLSGGQKQRAMIALALAPRPKLLLADEPTGALDTTVQREIMELIDEYRRRMRLAVLMVTHNIELAFAVSDSIYVMDAGRVAEAFVTRAFDRSKAVPETLRLLDGRRQQVVASMPTPAGTPVVLETNDLSKSYRKPRVHALKPISLTVKRGTILAIVGESGSGKTTLGRLLVGLVQPSSGAIQVGANHSKPKLPCAKVIQMVFQDPATSLDPDRSVEQLLVETMKVNGIGASKLERRQLAQELLARVGLPPSALDRRPTEFSGGERQRIAIARAISVSPEILVCDEGVSALDAHVQGEVLSLLVELRRDLGLTILFITHDLSLVANFADEMAVLKDGKLVEMGPVAAIINGSNLHYTRNLIAAQYHLPAGM